MSTGQYYNPLRDRNVNFGRITLIEKVKGVDSIGFYKVYMDEKQYVLVQAETAKQAIIKSAIAKPYKIRKADDPSKTLFISGELKIKPEEKNAVRDINIDLSPQEETPTTEAAQEPIPALEQVETMAPQSAEQSLPAPEEKQPQT